MPRRTDMSPADDRHVLQADCASCSALCCVALPFSAGAGFAINKDGGTPCPNLLADFGCGIHSRLRHEGFAGCSVFDCFGAGQKVTQHTFAGQDWRQAPHAARDMFDSFGVMRQLHELLWYLVEVLEHPATASIHDELRAALDETHQLTLGSAEDLVALDVAAHRSRVDVELVRASELVRATITGRKRSHRSADLVGADLKGADLRGAQLRGAWLMAADLRHLDLRAADVIGADLRDADLRAADLTGALFLTQAQVNAARGDAGTGLPSSLTRPGHW